jgi:hypothetical protein
MMRLFGTHRDLATATNRVIVGFYAVIAVLMFLVAALAAAHHLLGVW